jgi:hypothetical protein
MELRGRLFRYLKETFWYVPLKTYSFPVITCIEERIARKRAKTMKRTSGST